MRRKGVIHLTGRYIRGQAARRAPGQRWAKKRRQEKTASLGVKSSQTRLRENPEEVAEERKTLRYVYGRTLAV